MSRIRVCCRCGAEVLAGELDGLCPNCVARAAFAEEPSSEALPLRDLNGPDGRQFGDYELVEEIARGGMGVVYKARQISLNRTVAVKMILAGELASAADVQRFLAEAEAAADLQHPNIVAIHEIGQHEGQHYFSMEYVEGTSLAQLPGERRDLGAEWCRRCAGYLKTVAEAIEYAHQRGTLHRDLKPSNILIDSRDRPRITDFGLAKRAKYDSDLTLSGQIIGSPNFMPPEQASGRRAEIGPPSDVYSLGAVLYFLLTAKPPFQGGTVHDTLSKVLNQEPTAPRSLNPAVSRDLETVCLKCLEKSPARRYPSAQALAGELARFLAGDPVYARPISPVLKLWRTARRHQIAALLGVALVLSLVIVAVLIGPRVTSQSVAEMPTPSGQGISGVIDGKFYLTSACAGLSDNYPKSLFAYDPKANRWEQRAPSLVSHSTPGGGVISGKLYLAGGEDGTNGATAILEVYDPARNEWRFLKPMPTPRRHCAGVVLEQRLFVLGGVDDSNFLATVEAYEPATDSWSTQPNLRTARCGLGAAVINGRIFVIGGVTNALSGVACMVETWKPGETNWSLVALSDGGRSFVPVAEPFVTALHGVLYVFGGSTSAGAVDRAQCLVHGDRGWLWFPQTEMPAIRYMGCGAQAYGDEIWLFGGWTMHPDSNAVPHPDVFIFSPKRNSWRSSVPPKRGESWSRIIAVKNHE
jgi:serine/threonine protein kinase